MVTTNMEWQMAKASGQNKLSIQGSKRLRLLRLVTKVNLKIALSVVKEFTFLLMVRTLDMKETLKTIYNMVMEKSIIKLTGISTLETIMKDSCTVKAMKLKKIK